MLIFTLQLLHVGYGASLNDCDSKRDLQDSNPKSLFGSSSAIDIVSNKDSSFGGRSKALTDASYGGFLSDSQKAWSPESLSSSLASSLNSNEGGVTLQRQFSEDSVVAASSRRKICNELASLMARRKEGSSVNALDQSLFGTKLQHRAACSPLLYVLNCENKGADVRPTGMFGKDKNVQHLNRVCFLQLTLGPHILSEEYRALYNLWNLAAKQMEFADGMTAKLTGLKNAAVAELVRRLWYRTFSRELASIHEVILDEMHLNPLDSTLALLEVIKDKQLMSSSGFFDGDIVNNQVFIDWAFDKLESHPIYTLRPKLYEAINAFSGKSLEFSGMAMTCLNPSDIDFEVLWPLSRVSLGSLLKRKRNSCLLSSRVAFHQINEDDANCIPVMLKFKRAYNLGFLSANVGHRLHHIVTCNMQDTFAFQGSLLRDGKLSLYFTQE